MNKKILTLLGLILFGIVGRLTIHIPNATPITAISLAAQRHVGRTWAVLVPLIAMTASDIAIGFYNWKILLSVYISFAIIGITIAFTKKYLNAASIIGVTVCTSVFFFLVTNSAVWLFSSWYEKNLAGFLYCLILGLPFLASMMLGDMFYSLLLIKIPEVTARKFPLFIRILNTFKIKRKTYSSANC